MNLKVSRPIIYGGVATIAVAAWLLTADEPTKPAPTRKAPPAAKKAASGFLAEDYSAAFPPVTDPGRNVFRPLVARTGTADAGINLAPNAIPLDFAAGEPNWIFTGIAIIDGAPVALLENSSTQEGSFVKHGDRWKSSTIARITPETVVLAGPGGLTRTVRILDTFETYSATSIRPLDLNAAVERSFGDELMISPEARVPGIEEIRASEEGLER